MRLTSAWAMILVGFFLCHGDAKASQVDLTMKCEPIDLLTEKDVVKGAVAGKRCSGLGQKNAMEIYYLTARKEFGVCVREVRSFGRALGDGQRINPLTEVQMAVSKVDCEENTELHYTFATGLAAKEFKELHARFTGIFMAKRPSVKVEGCLVDFGRAYGMKRVLKNSAFPAKYPYTVELDFICDASLPISIGIGSLERELAWSF